MKNLEVWAPKAKQMHLLLQGKKHPLKKNLHDLWVFEHPFVHGTEYSFFVDEEGPYPDPRSLSQPLGVHGPSCWIDHSQYHWKDHHFKPTPLSGAVIYELHIGTYTKEGTFQSLAEKLDHLFNLGITHLELMPVNGFSGKRGWGYDGVNLYSVYEPYGGSTAFKQFVDQCHHKGLNVILDVVYNHLGSEGNYLSKFAPYFKEHSNTPWGSSINFDEAESDFVRRFFIENALMWFRDYHIDALRLDATHAIIDQSATHFLEQLATEVRALSKVLRKPLSLIAESDLNDPRLINPTKVGGYGLDAQWNDDFHHSLHALLTKEKKGYYQDFGQFEQLLKVLTKAFAYDGNYSPSRKRHHGRSPLVHANGHNFITYIQNHDQIGNRVLGDRFTHLLSIDKIKIASALLLCSPFIPMLFQGEEWMASSPFLYFTDHQDPSLGQAAKEGRQREFAAFGWRPEEIADPQAEETFAKSKLQWEELKEKKHAEIFEWYRTLIQLRKSLPELYDGDLKKITLTHNTQQQWLIIERGQLLLTTNLSSTPISVPFAHSSISPLLLSSPEINCSSTTLFLPGETVGIWCYKSLVEGAN
ncbi:MAG: malto-oligosyltrehalose trehalohydrolase [Oligoflexia bacterium]|nr:malto-oligosyltrehalose trehalohydrolase [Oligoflexia bacterium]